MSMESLFENAWDHQDLQFIFLTPLVRHFVNFRTLSMLLADVLCL